MIGIGSFLFTLELEHIKSYLPTNLGIPREEILERLSRIKYILKTLQHRLKPNDSNSEKIAIIKYQFFWY